MPLSDVFLASPAELVALHGDESPLRLFEGADIKGADFVKLEQLFELAVGRAPVSQQGEFELAREPDGESVVLKMPEVLTRVLTKLSDLELPALAEKWAKLERHELDPFSVAHA